MKKIVALVLSLVMVLGLATVASAAGTYDLYAFADTTTAVDTAVTYAKVPAVEVTDGTGSVAYIDVDGTAYFQISKAEATKADFYLTNANDDEAVMYLRLAAAVGYTTTAKAFNDFGLKCGQYNKAVTDKADYYVITAGADKGKVAPADETGSLNVLVGGKVVVLGDFVDLNTHSWLATAVNTDGEPTAAVCAICAVKGVVYADPTKAPASVVFDATALTYDGTDYAVVAGTVAADAVEGDKVESAETFDAGIAMYVGMSVMAAAGSAVVLKKKD